MSRRELKQLVFELKTYVEMQKYLGVDRLPSASLPATEEQTHTDEYIEDKNDKKKKKVSGKLVIEDQSGIFSSPAGESLEDIRGDLGECTRCKLHKGRNSIVFGEGNPSARLVFVGEGPGRDEDQQGRPFVGRAGKLLTRIITAMGLKRSDVYICNVVKCRPPSNRNPEPDEVSACEPFLFRQLRAINPEVIVCLGSVATGLLLKTKNVKMSELRGELHQFGSSKLMITYHPAALLRNPNFKKPVWEDMKIVMKELGIPLSGD